MKIYIAGKITGLAVDVAESAFHEAARFLERQGHEALDPMRMVEQEAVASGQWFAKQEGPYSAILLDALRIVLDEADGLYMLANWRDSRGARIEHAIAEVLGKPIFYAASELPVGCDFPEPVETGF